MKAVDSFDRLLGEWETSGTLSADGAEVRVRGRTTIQRTGALVVVHATVSPEAFPDSVSVIINAEDGPATMHYFDERGVHRRYFCALSGGLWTLWRADEDWRESPGFNQRYLGEMSSDGQHIKGAWERGTGPAGDAWVVDFTLNYRRTG